VSSAEEEEVVVDGEMAFDAKEMLDVAVELRPMTLPRSMTIEPKRSKFVVVEAAAAAAAAVVVVVVAASKVDTC
jgi:hypothetical protein